MASNWAYLRKHWIKPEVYPLIGAMAAALGVCGVAMINKARDPSVTWNKSKRTAGVEAQLEGVDEVIPMWSSAKTKATRIFGRENPILESHKHVTGPVSVTVAATHPEEDEEPAEEDAAPEPEPVAADVPAAVESKPENPVMDVVDEAAETINAAIDAAIESAATATDATERAAASVAEPVSPAEDSSEPVSATLDGPKPTEN